MALLIHMRDRTLPRTAAAHTVIESSDLRITVPLRLQSMDGTRWKMADRADTPFSSRHPRPMDAPTSRPGSSHARIHSMPTELLTRIWRDTQIPDHSWDFSVFPSGNVHIIDPSLALEMGAVCKRWRLITLGTAWMWSQYCVIRLAQLKLLPTFLSRSGTAPLVIDLSADCEREGHHAPQSVRPWFHPMQRAHGNQAWMRSVRT